MSGQLDGGSSSSLSAGGGRRLGPVVLCFVVRLAFDALILVDILVAYTSNPPTGAQQRRHTIAGHVFGARSRRGLNL